MDPCTFLGAVLVFVGGPVAARRLLGPGPGPAPDDPGPADPEPPSEPPHTHLVSVGPGSRVGGLRVEAELGQGGMAVVWRVRDEHTGEVWALKQLLPHHARDPRVARRFLAEAELLARLDHPGVVATRDLVDSDGVVGFVMTYLEGHTLRGRLRDQGPMAPDAALALALAVLDALAYVHAQGVVHRDLKPANVFLTDEGGVVLVDFGIAKIADTLRTRTGTFLGTPAYMSPEQIVRPQAVDARSDLFSLGTVLYEALTGARPFEGETDWEVQQAILAGRHEPVHARLPSLPAALARGVEAALQVDPDARPPSAHALATMLRDPLPEASP